MDELQQYEEAAGIIKMAILRSQYDAAKKARSHADRMRSLAENKERELQKRLDAKVRCEQERCVRFIRPGVMLCCRTPGSLSDYVALLSVRGERGFFRAWGARDSTRYTLLAWASHEARSESIR